ncbi:small ribosomal subunit protein mS23 [Phymastichus coffea]|uniref:small ribosomal subunit protein mS23 n=1 Tax=Phymastichus coffea TaxID=108790 RepID=UPI00273C1381|nr:small ribosomal subunit protein mS23 [Phymastichus coffea]XP_058788881.1 small ribosomal subunit protein mS23 [Phymastichus coffea]
MAQSRLEKIGTIYERVTSLIKAGAMKEETKPLWVDIYKAFPPKYEPRYDRPFSKIPIREIFYPEDNLRARFHKEYKHFSFVNLADNNAVSKTEQFLIICKNLQKSGIETELYERAIEEFLSKFNAEHSQRETRADEDRSTKKPRSNIDTDRLLQQVMDQGGESGEKKAKDNMRNENELTPKEKEKYRPIRLSMEKIVEVMKTEEKKSE